MHRAGVDGLAAMQSRRAEGKITLHRPLLEASRANLRKYLEARDITWIDDPSNSDDINPDTDESWAHALLHEARHHPSSREPIPAPPTETEPPQSALSAEPLSAESDFQDLAMSSDSGSSPSDQRHYGQSNARAQQPPYSDLRQDSIPLQRNHSGKIRVLAWSLIILAVLGVVISQLAWVQFDRFSKIPQLRPFYETGCELVGCTLPPLVDMSAIDSRKLVVKTNPANRNELIVEAVIINGAAFAQPFPAIVLTFADLNGQVVTKRVFSPADYLADGGAQLREMPPQTPVHIAIAIKDPGQSAVSYNIDFRPEPE